MNVVNLIGNITKDLELRKTKDNKSVLDFTIAVNEGYGDNKTTDFIQCQVWNIQADNMVKYCNKGSKVAVNGRIRTSQYEKNGQTIYKTYVVANSVEFLNNKKTTEVEQESKEETNYVDTRMKEQQMGFNATFTELCSDDNLPFY